jgi:hypothetical protein
VKHPQGIEVDGYGFIIVDFRNVGHKDEPWVRASTVAKCFTYLIQKTRRNTLLFLANNELSELAM